MPDLHLPTSRAEKIWIYICLVLLIFIFLLPFFFDDASASKDTEPLSIQPVVGGLEHPWGLDFLPDGTAIVSERSGRLRLVSANGQLSAPLEGVPQVFASGQGGLLDVAVSPNFRRDHLIYFTYSEQDNAGLAGTAVARARLAGNGLDNVEVIFRQVPKTKGGNHFGSRIVFMPDGALFVGLGERFAFADEAQTLDTHMGKVIRIYPDGTVPKDNPFVHMKGAMPEIWSYGHRNIQGAALHPRTQVLWIVEHGPRGGDEINIPQAGKNYGWPKACYGSHYSMVPIKDEHAEQGFVEPVYYWTPSIAPSGMMFYSGRLFPEWEGNIFIGALAGSHLVRLEVDDNSIINEHKLLTGLDERIRDVVEGPDGAIYVLTDSDDGQLLRLTPK